METNKIDELWKDQEVQASLAPPNELIKKAKQQRKGQFTTLLILTLTLGVIAVFTWQYARQWNTFAIGLTLMIGSLVFRIALEGVTLYRKEQQLMVLAPKAFQAYLKRHYQNRLQINYFVTPVCFLTYVIGFVMLLPYFKEAFSNGFYTYVVISGFVSFAVLLWIIIRSIRKEQRFLKTLLLQK